MEENINTEPGQQADNIPEEMANRIVTDETVMADQKPLQPMNHFQLLMPNLRNKRPKEETPQPLTSHLPDRQVNNRQKN